MKLGGNSLSKKNVTRIRLLFVPRSGNAKIVTAKETEGMAYYKGNGYRVGQESTVRFWGKPLMIVNEGIPEPVDIRGNGGVLITSAFLNEVAMNHYADLEAQMGMRRWQQATLWSTWGATILTVGAIAVSYFALSGQVQAIDAAIAAIRDILLR